MHVFDRKGYSLKSVILMIPILGKLGLTVNVDLIHFLWY